MKEKFQRFFYGRYGIDELNLVLLFLFFILSIVQIWTRSMILMVLDMLILGICYYRMLSRKLNQRRQENIRFMRYYQPVKNWIKDKQDRFRDRKTHRYFRCPHCHQRLRVPKGKGNITITCVRCRTKFDARS